MSVRMRWEFDTQSSRPSTSGIEKFSENCEKRDFLLEILAQESLTTHFQPICSLNDISAKGYEALTRLTKTNKLKGIDELFNVASDNNLSNRLDKECIRKILENTCRHGIPENDSLIFINICPNSLKNKDDIASIKEVLFSSICLKPENIVLEITENAVINNYEIFQEAIAEYRAQGCRIAIDDFGVGYGGLKMLAVIEPDYIKIDRHLIKDIDKAIIKYNLVNSVVTACHRIGINVIAEGVETESDMQVCSNLGIQLFQGYYFAKPSENIYTTADLNLSAKFRHKSTANILNKTPDQIGDIARFRKSLSTGDSVHQALDFFNKNKELLCVPVVDGKRICGILNRHRFMERHLVGPYGYGFSLNYYKKVKDVMETHFMQVESNLALEDVSKMTKLRSYDMIYDDIFVTENGLYQGTVAVQKLLQAITEKSIKVAMGSNPLTSLPGNEFIQREIARMLAQSIHIDICYLDIDNFKPYNDSYGFEKGDRVLKQIGKIISETVTKMADSKFAFTGHIGGDDFIFTARPKESINICQKIIERFESDLPEFHGEDVYNSGMYSSCDRQGNEKSFDLLSVSIGVVSTEVYKFKSCAEVSSVATEVKRKAKSIRGSSIVRDRRLYGKKCVTPSCCKQDADKDALKTHKAPLSIIH